MGSLSRRVTRFRLASRRTITLPSCEFATRTNALAENKFQLSQFQLSQFQLSQFQLSQFQLSHGVAPAPQALPPHPPARTRNETPPGGPARQRRLGTLAPASGRQDEHGAVRGGGFRCARIRAAGERDED